MFKTADKHADMPPYHDPIDSSQHVAFDRMHVSILIRSLQSLGFANKHRCRLNSSRFGSHLRFLVLSVDYKHMLVKWN